MMYGLQNNKMVTNVHANVPARVYGPADKPLLASAVLPSTAPSQTAYKKVAGITHFANPVQVAAKDEKNNFLRDSTIIS